MPMKHTLDTHPFVWFLGDSPRLGPGAARVLQDPASELILPATALAEACWIIERGRVELTLEAVLRAIDEDPRIIVLPLDRSVIERSTRLTSINEMHDRE